jgi:hypothetical protein
LLTGIALLFSLDSMNNETDRVPHPQGGLRRREYGISHPPGGAPDGVAECEVPCVASVLPCEAGGTGLMSEALRRGRTVPVAPVRARSPALRDLRLKPLVDRYWQL